MPVMKGLDKTMRIELRTPQQVSEPVLHELGTLILERREACTVGAAMRRYAQAQAALNNAWHAEHIDIVTGGSGVPPVSDALTIVGDDDQSDWYRCGSCLEMVLPGWQCRCKRLQAAQMAAVRENRGMLGAPEGIGTAVSSPDTYEGVLQDAPTPARALDLKRWLIRSSTWLGCLAVACEICYYLYRYFTPR